MARSLSDVQEAAQLLAGEAMPLSLISALLSRTAVGQNTNTVVALVNLTAYDGWTERVCKNWSEGGLKFKSISFSKSLTIAQYVEKALALELLEDIFLLDIQQSYFDWSFDFLAESERVKINGIELKESHD